MAREMTPQERAAIYTYHKVFDGYNFLSGPKGMEEIVTHDMELVSLEDHEDALQETRRAALLEAAHEIERFIDYSGGCVGTENDPRVVAVNRFITINIVPLLNRLAQEG